MGVVKRWERARTAMVVAECGTGKTLISLGAITFIATGIHSTLWQWFRPTWSRSGRVKHF